MKPPDDIAWVHRVNERWLVREGFRHSATAYLEALARTDPVRLRRSCARARLLLTRRGPLEDPKPWFYAGLFSLATLAEADRFLKGRDFTLACIPGLADSTLGSLRQDNVAGSTWEKVQRIRLELEKLAVSEAR